MRKKDKDDNPFPPWLQEDPDGSVRRCYQWAVRNAQSQIDWYEKKRRTKRRFSQCLLVATILLGGLGALCPLANEAFKECLTPTPCPSVSFLHIGYILLALAGIVMVFDRSFNFSAGWMAFMEAKFKLEQMLNAFRFEWTQQTSVSVAANEQESHRKELLSLLEKFTYEVEKVVIAETEGWIQQFKKSLSKLEDFANGPHK